MAEENVVTVDFRGAPPATGNAQDYVTPGIYRFQVTKMDLTNTRDGSKKMIVATFQVVTPGDEQGKRLVDRFTLPRPGTDDSLYPVQRFHAFILACGAKMGERKANVSLNVFVRREFEAEVRDYVQEATDQYPKRTTSQINEYIFGETKTASAPADDDEEEDIPAARTNGKVAASVATQAKAAPAAVAVAEEDDEGAVAEDEEEEETAPAPPPVRRGRPAKAAAPVADDDDDIDSLFS